MTKELTRVVLISAAIILLLPIPFIEAYHPLRDYMLGVGITALGIAMLWILIGFVMVLIDSTRKFGQAFLLTAAMLLLVSFTLCSTGGGLLG
jgi:hypothetical protein